MSDIRIYDFEFRLLKICSDYISSNWSIYYNDVGTFEAHFPLQNDVSQVLFSHDYLVAVQDDKTAIITGKQADEDIVIYGRSPNWLFSKRVTLPFEELSGNVEWLTHRIIATAFDDVIETEKGIVWGEASNATEVYSLSRSEIKTTLDVVKECLTKDNAGHRLYFDSINKAWVYTVLKGKKLIQVVSEDNLNAHETKYSYDVLDYFTGGWFSEEQKEDEEGNKPDPIWKRICADDTKTGILRWDCILSGCTDTEAEDDMAKKIINKVISVQTCDFIWGKDYNLGDIVTVKIIKGVLELTVEKRIKGVHIWSEHDSYGEEPIFED